MQRHRNVNQHDAFEKLHLGWSLSKRKVQRSRSGGNETREVAGPRCWKVLPGLFMPQATGDQCWGLSTTIMNQLLICNKTPQISVA